MLGKRKSEISNERRDKLASKIAGRLIHSQAVITSYLNRKAEMLSTRGKKVFLISVCAILGGLSLYTTIDSLLKPRATRAMPKVSITVLRHTYNDDERNRANPSITKNEYAKIRRFQQYMDSLKTTPSGKLLYDSIVSARPGLIDSVKMFVSMYNQKQ